MNGEEKKMKRAVISVAAVFCLLLLGIVVYVNSKSAEEQRAILERSIEDELISISIAAREMLDVDEYLAYQSLADVEANFEQFSATREHFRSLAREADVEFVYVLREVNGEYLFIFDSDEEDESVFIPYEVSQVHLDAFAGKDSAGVMNVEDAYGVFNTGAVPILKDGTVVGIVATDMDTALYESSIAAARRNILLLILATGITLALMLTLVFVLLARLRKAQDKLKFIAHHDAVTGLPNRQYLMEYLADLTQRQPAVPFALFFVDLDNFKTVNDNAGHDAGDELLRHIGEYLDSSARAAKAFRPSAGRLNVAARVGGDEFVQVIPNIATAEEGAAQAQKLLEGFGSQMLDRYIEKYHVGLSVGVALFPYHTKDYNVLIKYADIAMYHAKRGGKNGYRVYDDDMAPKDEK